MDNRFKGIIWTNHALQRLKERGISQGDAWATWSNPQQSRKGASGNWVYYRTYGNVTIEVVAKQNEKKEWIILSVWSRPAGGRERYSGTEEFTFWDAIKKLLNRRKSK